MALMSDKYSKERANAPQGRLFLKNSEKVMMIYCVYGVYIIRECGNGIAASEL